MTTTNFCPLCDCFLWLELDDDKKLQYHCKNCDNIIIHEQKNSLCVLDSNFNDDDTSYNQYINKHLKNDPTLPRVNNIECTNAECTKTPDQENEVIFVKYDQKNMKYLYHCTYCEQFWTHKRQIETN